MATVWEGGVLIRPRAPVAHPVVWKVPEMKMDGWYRVSCAGCGWRYRSRVRDRACRQAEAHAASRCWEAGDG